MLFFLNRLFWQIWLSITVFQDFCKIQVSKSQMTVLVMKLSMWFPSPTLMLPYIFIVLLSHFSHVWLCDPIDSSPPGSPPPAPALSLGLSRQEHWSGLPFPSPMHESKRWKWSHSVMSDLETPWTAAYQAPPSMGFSRQEYWSAVPLPSLMLT